MYDCKRLSALGIVLIIVISALFAAALPFYAFTALPRMEPLPSAHAFGRTENAALDLHPSDFTVRSETLPLLFQALTPMRPFAWLPTALELSLFILLCIICAVQYKIESLCFYIASSRLLRAPPTQA